MALTILKVGKFDMLPELEAQLKERGTYYVDNALSESERAAVRARTDIVVASGGSQFKASDFDSCPNLRAIVCFSVGYDGIDIPSAIAHNVFITHTPNVLNDDVANTALMLLLNCTREAKAASAKKSQPVPPPSRWKSATTGAISKLTFPIATLAPCRNWPLGVTSCFWRCRPALITSTASIAPFSRP